MATPEQDILVQAQVFVGEGQRVDEAALDMADDQRDFGEEEEI